MSIVYAVVAATLTITPEPQLVPPTVTRPEPRLIVVSGADFAHISPPWIESLEGLDLISAELSYSEFGGSLVFGVEPQVNYFINAGIRGNTHFDEVQGWDVRAATTFFEFDVSLSYENKLDWIIYQQIIWKQNHIDFRDEFGITTEQMIDALGRVQLMLQRDEEDEQ